MIGIIVPVWQEERLLKRCTDSILAESRSDLRLFLIDDGSTDGSGALCDETARSDARVTVFHTENRGLAAARNLGIRAAIEAGCEYLIFIDSDDWIEPEMIGRLLQTAEETGAEIVCCGFDRVYYNMSVPFSRPSAKMNGPEAVEALIYGRLTNAAWGKLWKAELFDGLSYPEGRVYEDVSLAYRLYEKAALTVSIPDVLCHYTQQEQGISRSSNVSFLRDLWQAHRERCDYIRATAPYSENEALVQKEAENTVRAILKVRSGYASQPKEARDAERSLPEEIASFVCKVYPSFRKLVRPLHLKIVLFTAKYCGRLSYLPGNLITALSHRCHPGKPFTSR